MHSSSANGAPAQRVFSVATRCATPADFVLLFQKFIDHSDGSLFIVSREPREIGTKHPFQIKLKDGTVILRGNARIVKVFAAGEGPGGKQGVSVRLTRLDEASRAVWRELLGEPPADEFEAAPTTGSRRRRTAPPPSGRKSTAPPGGGRRPTPPPATPAPVIKGPGYEMRPSKPPRDPIGIHGTLEQFGLSSMLTFLELERKTGVLIVTNADGATGRVFLRKGEIVRARLDGTRNPINDAAVSALLSWDEGRFEFITLDVEGD